MPLIRGDFLVGSWFVDAAGLEPTTHVPVLFSNTVEGVGTRQQAFLVVARQTAQVRAAGETKMGLALDAKLPKQHLG